MIIVFGGIKGGSGKTTLATNICQMRASDGFKVLLIDSDDQKSAYDWSLVRESSDLKPSFPTICLGGTYLHKTILKMKDDYDDIIIDAGGRETTSQRSALSCADKFIVPFKPRSLDVWTRGAVKSLVNDFVSSNPKLKSYSLINQSDPKGKDNEISIEALDECEGIERIPVLIGNRKSFCNAAADGMGVHELKIKDEKACMELKILYDYIYG